MYLFGSAAVYKRVPGEKTARTPAGASAPNVRESEAIGKPYGEVFIWNISMIFEKDAFAKPRPRSLPKAIPEDSGRIRKPISTTFP